MAKKASMTMIQRLNYQEQYAALFAANQVLFNRVAAFYFEVIQAHDQVLQLGSMDALRALEQLTHATEHHPRPVMPLAQLADSAPDVARRWCATSRASPSRAIREEPLSYGVPPARCAAMPIGMPVW